MRSAVARRVKWLHWKGRDGPPVVADGGDRRRQGAAGPVPAPSSCSRCHHDGVLSRGRPWGGAADALSCAAARSLCTVHGLHTSMPRAKCRWSLSCLLRASPLPPFPASLTVYGPPSSLFVANTLLPDHAYYHNLCAPVMEPVSGWFAHATAFVRLISLPPSETSCRSRGGRLSSPAMLATAAPPCGWRSMWTACSARQPPTTAL